MPITKKEKKKAKFLFGKAKFKTFRRLKDTMDQWLTAQSKLTTGQ